MDDEFIPDDDYEEEDNDHYISDDPEKNEINDDEMRLEEAESVKDMLRESSEFIITDPKKRRAKRQEEDVSPEEADDLLNSTIMTGWKRKKRTSKKPKKVDEEDSTLRKKAPPKKRRKKNNLNKQLLSYQKDELIDVITNLVGEDADLEDRVFQLLPAPDMSAISNELEKLKNKVFRAFPYAKWGTNRGKYAYNRVKGQISTFRQTFNKYLSNYKKSRNWGHLREYLRVSAPIIESLPVFDEDVHNKFKGTMMKSVGVAYKTMLKAKNNGLSGGDLRNIESQIMRYSSYTGVDEALKICRVKMGK